MIVDWRAASHMRTDMVLDALEMARWSRGTGLEGLETAAPTLALSLPACATANGSPGSGGPLDRDGR
jgi:transposase InsO family protein